jgi:glycosyltransferase involved in cell wall biosynthesis
MKKILIATGIFYPDIGGPASYGNLLAGELVKAGAEATVLTYSTAIQDKGDNNLPFKVVRVWRKWPKFLRHLVYFFRVASAAKNADTVFALNAVSAGLPALTAAKLFKKKFFVKIVGDYAWETAVNKGKTIFLINDFQNMPHKGWIAVLHRLQSWVCKNSDQVIVPSEYLAGIVEGWGTPRAKIQVIYNGVDFKPAEIGREEARRKVGVPGSIILSIGRLVPWKGFRMLIKIMPQLLSINQFFRIVIIGSGPDKKILEAMVKNLGLERKVYLVGSKSKDEIAEYMAVADMFLLNTGYEGFSHQILETMSAGLPLITTAVGGNVEVVRQGENGFMVKYNDEFNLVEAIKTLWQTEELRKQFAEEGKKTVKKFSHGKMISETMKLLLE